MSCPWWSLCQFGCHLTVIWFWLFQKTKNTDVWHRTFYTSIPLLRKALPSAPIYDKNHTIKKEKKKEDEKEVSWRLHVQKHTPKSVHKCTDHHEKNTHRSVPGVKHMLYVHASTSKGICLFSNVFVCSSLLVSYYLRTPISSPARGRDGRRSGVTDYYHSVWQLELLPVSPAMLCFLVAPWVRPPLRSSIVIESSVSTQSLVVENNGHSIKKSQLLCFYVDAETVIEKNGQSGSSVRYSINSIKQINWTNILVYKTRQDDTNKSGHFISSTLETVSQIRGDRLS